MAGPRPGSHKYDIKRARLRKRIEDTGRAADQEANDVANQILQENRGQQGVLRGDRGMGPKSERIPGEPR